MVDLHKSNHHLLSFHPSTLVRRFWRQFDDGVKSGETSSCFYICSRPCKVQLSLSLLFSIIKKSIMFPSEECISGDSPETPAGAASSRQHSYDHRASTINAIHFSPPSAGQTENGPAFQFRGAPSSQSAALTFRVLHDVTPRPSPRPSPQPESSYSPMETLPVELDSSPLPMSLQNQSSHEGENIEAPFDMPELVIPPEALLPTRTSTSSDLDLSSLSITQSKSPDAGLAVHSRRISDFSDVSANDDHSRPYDVRDETAPFAPFFTSTFQDALKEGFEIAKGCTAAVGNLEQFLDLDSYEKGLLAEGKRLSAFQCSDTRTIALLGDSGEGKYKINFHLQDNG